MSALKVRIEVDANRDGEVTDEPGDADWVWGPKGHGAIAAFDCDPEFSIQSTAEVRVVVEGERDTGQQLLLSMNAPAARVVTLWADVGGSWQPILGVVGDRVVEHRLLRWVNYTLRVQPTIFPSAGFDGLIEIVAAAVDENGKGGAKKPLVEGRYEVADGALLRVAPWIMPSTLQPPDEVYVVNDGPANLAFMTGLSAACQEASVPLTEITFPESADGADIWIQDEIEVGYTHSPTLTQIVILDGPRDRQLNGVARRELTRDGVGVTELHRHVTGNSLNSFGNLEVSPPVQANGTNYALGRIILGTKKPNDDAGRKADLALRQFLYAQLVQAPLEIYTDWLYVGHVDEIVSFVPDAASERGFRVFIASPSAFEGILQRLHDDGHSDAVFWEKKFRILRDGSHGPRADKTVSQLLNGTTNGDEPYSFEVNKRCTAILDDVREELKSGLGLADEDFTAIPVGFKLIDGKSIGFFPDMVNHLILGNVSVVPDPYGPNVDGRDPLQEAFRKAVGDRAGGVHFIDDWFSYHEQLGEVHCGTNVRRKPDLATPWWALNSIPGAVNYSPVRVSSSRA